MSEDFMKLLSYRDGGLQCVGFISNENLIAPVTVPNALGLSPMRRLLAGGEAAIDVAYVAAERMFADRTGIRPLHEVAVEPLVPDPEKILCVGFNYHDHISEMSADVPSDPNIFAKFNNVLIPHGGKIVIPKASQQIDYEGELAVIIGRVCKGVIRSDALDYVAGYTIFNDVSARDLQMRTSQFTLGKSIDSFGPLGPVMTLAKDIGDPRGLRITTRLNGEVMQDELAGKMIYSIEHIIESISAVMTLVPGDVISTGTPAGVGWKRKPPRFMVSGDVIDVEISGIGTLHNTVV